MKKKASVCNQGKKNSFEIVIHIVHISSFCQTGFPIPVACKMLIYRTICRQIVHKDVHVDQTCIMICFIQSIGLTTRVDVTSIPDATTKASATRDTAAGVSGAAGATTTARNAADVSGNTAAGDAPSAAGVTIPAHVTGAPGASPTAGLTAATSDPTPSAGLPSAAGPAITADKDKTTRK